MLTRRQSPLLKDAGLTFCIVRQRTVYQLQVNERNTFVWIVYVFICCRVLSREGFQQKLLKTGSEEFINFQTRKVFFFFKTNLINVDTTRHKWWLVVNLGTRGHRSHRTVRIVRMGDVGAGNLKWLGHVKKIEFFHFIEKNIIHLLNTKLNEHSIVASVESASRGKYKMNWKYKIPYHFKFFKKESICDTGTKNANKCFLFF